MRKIMFLALAMSLVFAQCKKKDETTAESKTKESDVQTGTEQPAGKEVMKAPSQPEVDVAKKYLATIKTSKGEIRVELFAKEAPLSVTNFKQLAEKGFYKNLTFHRVVPGFVVQGGDPTATGTGGPGYTIPAEIKLPHKEGALAWARLPDTDPMGNPVNPKKESSGSQFYITLASQPSLDNEYTVFGQTVAGMEIVQQIQRGDVIQDVIVTTE